ncbi:hypothetical protein EYF80_027052 [Liparis tanakae]|uniref:Uncharacterized protein n=1 Tax=Liparis tanakae TaxID=230148 RepID=A0A4Z2HB09_9TELE|nr:hypothetical protein EYF80_027052 [Liparis tanakae]
MGGRRAQRPAVFLGAYRKGLDPVDEPNLEMLRSPLSGDWLFCLLKGHSVPYLLRHAICTDFKKSQIKYDRARVELALSGDSCSLFVPSQGEKERAGVGSAHKSLILAQRLVGEIKQRRAASPSRDGAVDKDLPVAHFHENGGERKREREMEKGELKG